MNTKQKLTKRQLAVIEQLFKGELDEQAVLDKYKVSHNLYKTWLANKDFADELDRRIESSLRQSALLIARYAPLAAAKLVQLTDSENPETARKACLDIISFQTNRESWGKRDDRRGTIGDGRRMMDDERAAEGGSEPVQGFALPPDTASRLLSALAEESTEKEPP